jgi:hypothetical protein
MPNMELPEWLRHTIFTGREDEDNEGEGDGDGEGDDSGDDGSSGGEGEGGEGGSGSDGDDEGNVDGLKSALEKERAKARRLERENNRLKRKKAAEKDQQTDEEKKDLEETQSKLTKSEEKVGKLATRLRDSARDAAILKAAEELNFIDPTDALTDRIRQAVEVDQDDEDPSDIEVDVASAVAAVKKLANSKKHLIGKPNGGAPSGSRLRRDQGGDDGANQQKLGDLYPSLQ